MLNVIHYIPVVIMVAGCRACCDPQTTGHTVLSVDLRRVISQAENEDRSEWWPAVAQLGTIAAGNESLCQKIWEEAKVNTLGMKFVLVQPGTFTMGPDSHRVFNTQRAHSVKIAQRYYIAVTEVTNAQFQQIFPRFKEDAEYSPDPDSPAVNVSWKDADRFCKLLSEKENVVYRLPTEAEWEYACRAGTQTRYSFGSNRARLPEFAWCNYANGRASPVGMLKPNAWRIYDMHGNAFEWVSDWHSHRYYSECAAKGTVQDPKGPERGWTHVLRGGGWQVRNPLALTSTFRTPLPIFDRYPFDPDPVGLRQTIGFRVVRVPQVRGVGANGDVEIRQPQVPDQRGAPQQR